MLEVGVIALVMVLLSLLGVVWDIASGLLISGIDGIFLLLVCLMMGGVFSLQLLYLTYERRRGAHSSDGK
jgi:hypothetical protein